MAANNVFGKTFSAPDSVFFQTVGFGGMFNFFSTFFTKTLKEKQSFVVADATNILSVLSHTDVLQWKKMGTGSAAEIAVGKDLTEDFRQLSLDPKGTKTTIKLK